MPAWLMKMLISNPEATSAIFNIAFGDMTKNLSKKDKGLFYKALTQGLRKFKTDKNGNIVKDSKGNPILEANTDSAIYKALFPENTNANANVNDYTRGKGEFIVEDIAMPIAGDAAHVAGNIIGTRNSLLGQALMSMKSLNSDSPYARFGVDTSNASKAAGAGAMARGAIAKDIGDTVADRIQAIADAAKQSTEKKLQMKWALDNPDTPSEYYHLLQSQEVSNRGKYGRR